MGVRVYLKDSNEKELTKALRKLKRACEKEGLMREFRRHEFYEKPCEARRRKRNRAAKLREDDATKSSGPQQRIPLM